MYPPIFPLINASSAVKALIGSNPVRFYQWGKAPQNVTKPYAVWRIASGDPENFINERPKTDNFTVQVDIYESPSNKNGTEKVRSIAAAIRDAIEEDCYITSWLGESRDPDTQNFHFAFQCDWIVNR